jgi:hypothetical protein
LNHPNEVLDGFGGEPQSVLSGHMPFRFELLEEAMKKFWLVGFAVIVALALAPAANADSYKIVLSGASISGTGYITVASDGLITSGSFTFSTLGSASSLTGNLVEDSYSTGTPAYYDLLTGAVTSTEPSAINAEYDDLLTSTTTPHFDYDGILISLSNGGVLNIFSLTDGTDMWGEYDNGTWFPSSTTSSEATVLLTSSPEPSSLLLLGTGLLVLAGFLFRKARPNLVRAA